jgi:predicted RND superfamily exporter protein
MKNKKIAILTITIMIATTVAGLIYTQDLEQKNKETIFLTETGERNYSRFKEKFEEKEIVVLKKETQDKFKFQDEVIKLKNYCDEKCTILSSKNFPKSFQSVFKLESPNSHSLILIGKTEGSLKKLLNHMKTSSYWGLFKKGLHLSGVPFTNILLDKYSKKIKEVVFPTLFLGIFLCFLFMLRNFNQALSLFFPCILSASLSLTAIKFFFSQSNLITAIVPLMIFVINVSLVLHIFYTAKEVGTISLAIKHKRKPILLMISTTFIGFLSLYLSSLQAISTFGILSASLIVISSQLTILWLSKIDLILPLTRKKVEENVNKTSFIYNYFKTFSSKLTIVIISLFSLTIGLYVFSRIPIITDATRYFPKESRLRESMINVSRTVIGTPILEVIINTHNSVDIDIAFLKEIKKVEEVISREIKKINADIKMTSLNILVSKANMSYTGTDDIPSHILPYTALRSKIPEDIKEGLPIDTDYRLTIFSPPLDSKSYDVILTKVSQILKGKYKYTFNGLYFQLMTAQKEMISTLFYSFFISLLIISSLAFISFKNIKLFFIFMFVNIIPVSLSFIFLYLLKLSFNIATVMTYCISLGLIVDSSFHIIHSLKDPNIKYDFYFKTVITPVINGNIILSLCFFSFALNDFLPIREFGLCLSIVIFIGMFFDLKILPSLYLGKTKLLSLD